MKCRDCGHFLKIGDWPFCPDHSPPQLYHPFRPYWDEHIDSGGKPVYVSSLAQRWKLMRLNNADHRGRRVGDPHCEV